MARLVALVTLATILLPAQTPQPTFRAEAHLIVQTVTVKDKNGRPVQGLTARDFIVTEDGKPQEIAFVEYQPLDDAPASSVALVPDDSARTTVASPVSPDVVVRPIPGDARFRGRRLIVLYFDLYQMPFFDQMRTLESADRYIATKMTAADVVAVMLFDGRGVRLRQAFTDDRAALRETIQALMTAADERNSSGVEFDPGGAFGEDDDTFNIFATDRQLAALQTAVTDLGPLPEQKTLVYFGSGLRLNGTDNLAQMRATVNAAVRANVTLNPIDARGLVASAPLGDATRPSPGGLGMFNGAIQQAGITRGQQSQDTLYALAKDTGGRAMFDNNDLALGIAQAAQAVTGYYMVGYYTKNVAKDGRFRRVSVSLAPGVAGDVSYRAGYYGEKDFSKFNRADKERQLAEALKLEDPVTEIPMAAEVNYFQINRAEYFVPVSVRMPGTELTAAASGGASHVDIDMIGEIKDEHGVTIRNVRDLVRVPLDENIAAASNRLIQYETGFTILPGSYVIKLLARNASTGRMGTFQTSFIVPNLERETAHVPLSSVVLTNQRSAPGDAVFTTKQKVAAEVANPLVADGQKLIPAVGRTFHANRPLYVFLQAYERDATAVRPLVAYVTFYREGAKAFETEPLAVETWDANTKALPIRFTIAPGALTTGSYDCQVTVLDPASGRAAFRRAAIAVR
ncbi:MAG TPA: VWA domain-containing protein [Vicinamibacterales bacterium]|nr:VWA domain-containing protein [Vicinamibacterales bacterium]